ncbi:Mechanosensitive ion channel-domain-containing protein [Phycomyces blakesleeanus]
MSGPKTVRIADEEKILIADLPPVHQRNDLRRKEEPYSIDMKSDNFFYEPNQEPSERDSTLPRTPTIRRTLAKDQDENDIQNPFEDIPNYDREKDDGLYHLRVTESHIARDSNNNTNNRSTDPLIENIDIEDDDDTEFDWNDDPSQPQKPKRRRTARERFQAAIQRPCCWHFLSPFMKRFIIAILGSGTFVGVAVCVNVFLPPPSQAEMEDPNFTNVRSNVQLWMYWAAFMWHIGWITTVFIEMIPSAVSLWTKCCWGRRSERVKSTMEYYMAVKLYIGILLVASWNWGAWAFFLQHPFSSVENNHYSAIIWKVFACIFAASCFLFVQKSIIQLIATRFHQFAYQERLHESKHALKILDSLSKSENRRSRVEPSNLRNRRSPNGRWESGALSDNEGAAAYSTGVNTNQRPNNKRTTSTADAINSFQKKLQNIVMIDQPEARTRIERAKVDINSNEFAKKVAKKLFYSLAHPHGIPPGEADSKRSLYVRDFVPYFKTPEEAEKAFGVFDKDGNGNLTRREFRDTVLEIYRERKALSQSIRDTSQALGKVDAMLFIVSSIATIFVCLAVFQVDIWQSLVPLGSFLLALTFVFGNTCKTIFESVLFLFVTHPYDAGDYVIIDTQILLVHNMGLMGTVFIRADGQKIYAPTTVLMTKLITNVRRSGDMGESIVINIDFRTKTEDVHQLRDRITGWVNEQTRDFSHGFDLRVVDIIDVNQLIISMWLPHKGNWQDLGKRWQRHTRFVMALKDILSELNIVYELPSQKIRHSHDSSPFDAQSFPAMVTPQSFAADTQPAQSRLYTQSNLSV